jgi:hypothetical protein
MRLPVAAGTDEDHVQFVAAAVSVVMMAVQCVPSRCRPAHLAAIGRSEPTRTQCSPVGAARLGLLFGVRAALMAAAWMRLVALGDDHRVERTGTYGAQLTAIRRQGVLHDKRLLISGEGQGMGDVDFDHSAGHEPTPFLCA